MISVERVIEYCDLPSEAPLVKNDMDNYAESWPSKGNIDVQSLSVRYRSNLPLSLKELSFHIEGGSRVGVVGRTGRLFLYIILFQPNKEQPHFRCLWFSLKALVKVH